MVWLQHQKQLPTPNQDPLPGPDQPLQVNMGKLLSWYRSKFTQQLWGLTSGSLYSLRSMRSMGLLGFMPTLLWGIVLKTVRGRSE